MADNSRLNAFTATGQEQALPKPKQTQHKMRNLILFTFGILMSLSSYASVDEGIVAYNSGKYAVALKHFQQAAKAGDPSGKHMLASLYYQGHGVPKDLNHAVSLFKEAANLGYPPSLANLSLMYSKGDGVPADQRKAFDYGRKAAEAGDVQSQYNLGQAYRKGEGVILDFQQAAYWYRKAAEAGSLSAQNEFGLLYAQGHGVPLDYVKAYAWIDMPAKAGNPESIKNKSQLLQLLTPTDAQRAKELAAVYASRFAQKQ